MKPSEVLRWEAQYLLFWSFSSKTVPSNKNYPSYNGYPCIYIFSLYFNYHGIMYKAAKYVKNTIVPWRNGICCTLKRAADSFQLLAAELSFRIIIEL